MCFSRGWLPAAVLLLVLFPVSVQAQSGTELQQRLDRLFARWDHPTTPGLALAVLQDGRVLAERCYGLADLESARAITPDTPFEIASLSKQFTALAVLMLQQEHRLSLEDEVHLRLPELPDFGAPIKLLDLLHHTSGLREQRALLDLVGYSPQDVMTQADALRLIEQQRELNFAPGTRWMYSNTGYTLLAEMVARVSGQSFASFMQQRIFEPLGMRHSQVQDHLEQLILNRAQSYVALEGSGARNGRVILSSSCYGGAGVWTTLEDLIAWDRNFDSGQVGGPELMAQMQLPGLLRDGQRVEYGGGLFLTHYRGRALVEHSGTDGGFRSARLHFPEQHLSILMLSNSSELDPIKASHQVADLCFGYDPVPPPDPLPEAGATFHQGHLAEFSGDYRSSELSQIYRLRAAGEGLWLSGAKLHIRLVCQARDVFRGDQVVQRVHFIRAAGRVKGFTLDSFGALGLSFGRLSG